MERHYIRGKKLQNLLAANKITQMEMSDIIKYDMSSLSRAIHGKCPMPDDKIEAISDLLNVKKEMLINETKDIIVSNRKDKNSQNTFIPNCTWNNDYFKQQLKLKGITIKELSSRIHIDKTNYSSYNRGKTSPCVETVYKICKELGCSTEELIGCSGEYLNKLLKNNNKEPLFLITDLDGSNQNNDKKENSTNLKDNIISDEIQLTHFSGTNVIENIETINKNLILLAKIMSADRRMCLEKIENLNKTNHELAEEARNLRNKLTVIEDSLRCNCTNIEVKTNVEKQAFAENKEQQNNQATSITKVAAVPGNNYCTEKEAKTIAKTNTSRDSAETFKSKIYKLTSFISKKNNLIFNQVMYNNYNQFARTYGVNYNCLKKETKATSTLDAIYENPLYREIFFNMVCQAADLDKKKQ